MRAFAPPECPPPGAAWAIGNFDGVHAGHAALFAAARKAAPDARLGVLTFEPHPRRFFQPDAPPFRLYDAAARRRLLAEAGVDLMVEMTFDAALAATEPEAFIEAMIRDLAPVAVATGVDFRFGRARRGDTAMLAQRLGAAGVAYTPVAPVTDAVGPLSSSRARAALLAGDAAGALAALGRPWAMEGVVGRGDQRGRTIGFPTANVDPPVGILRPKAGVYAVRAGLPDDPAGPVERWFDGVANFGARPTVGGRSERLEVHLFDFQADLYDRPMRARFFAFIRGERKFDSLDALKAQIAADAAEARARLLTARRPTS